MMLSRMNTSYPVRQLRDEVDRLFSDFFPSTQGFSVAPTFPPMNVWDNADQLFVEAEVPGLRPDEFEISVVGAELTLRGQRGDCTPEGATAHRRERSQGSFMRVLKLPVEVDVNRVEAKLEQGVLLITLPKAEAAKPRKIEVKVSG